MTLFPRIIHKPPQRLLRLSLLPQISVAAIFFFFFLDEALLHEHMQKLLDAVYNMQVQSLDAK